MRKLPRMLVLAGSVLFSAAVGAQAARTGVTPVPEQTACKVRPPVLLAAGRAPLAPLRIDLARMAHRARSLHDVEHVSARARLLDGSWHATTAIARSDAVIRTAGVVRGQLDISVKVLQRYEATKTTAGTTPRTIRYSGHTDALGGGILGGQAGNDRLPLEPVGIGARWRVVNCDAIAETPAREVRTYTLRSISNGIVLLSFRDAVSLDPANRDAGTQKVGDQTVRFRLDSLHGTATGSVRLPLADAILAVTTRVTRMRFSFHAIATNLPTTPIPTKLVDTDTTGPKG